MSDDTQQMPPSQPGSVPPSRPGSASAGHSDRHRFIRAFTRGTSGAHNPGRLSMRPLAIGAVVLAAALVAVAIGAIPALLHSKRSAPVAHATSTTAAKRTVTHRPVAPAHGPAPGRRSVGPGGAPSGGGSSGGGSSSGGMVLGSNNSQPTGPGGGTGGSTSRSFSSSGRTGGSTGRSTSSGSTGGSSQRRGQAAPPPARFSALTGWACPQSAAASFRLSNWYRDGLNGFLDLDYGSFRGDGCKGSFIAMPMSGSATRDDTSNYATWTFHTGPVVRGTCRVSVYIPNDRNIEHVGGDPAHYDVIGATHQWFAINQHAELGRWVYAGGYRVGSGRLTVRLDSRGIDYTRAGRPDYAHIAVTDVYVSCTSD